MSSSGNLSVSVLTISGGRSTQHSACSCCNWLTHSPSSRSPHAVFVISQAAAAATFDTQNNAAEWCSYRPVDRDQSFFWSHVIADYKLQSDRDQKLIGASHSRCIIWMNSTSKTKNNWRYILCLFVSASDAMSTLWTEQQLLSLCVLAAPSPAEYVYSLDVNVNANQKSLT